MAKNKVALITGGSHRLGAATARTLHEAGMNLVLHYRTSRDAAHKLQKELNGKRENSVVLVQADLLSMNALPALIKETHSAWGQIDALINNASTFYNTPIGSATEKHWDDLFGSNAKAPFFLAQAAAPYLKKSQGCIVNMIDIHAERPLKEHTLYCMAKAALAMLTKSLAKELGPEVRVNGVAPGAIMWPNDLDDVTKQRILNRTFLKRKGEPIDIASTIRFLVLDAPYITGQIISVDGGRSLHS
jgi:pteridine reductase